MKQIATYKLIGNKKLFELIRDEITTKYVDDDGQIKEKALKVVNSTYILPTQMPNDHQSLEFVGDDESGEWIVFEKQVFDKFFLKENGTEFDVINLCDFDKYTKITPLPITDKSTQKFNDDTQSWEYVFIDTELALKIAKEDKTKKLKEEYDISKNITLQDKNYKIIITAKTPERMHFVNLIETLKQEDKFETYLKVYQQKEDTFYLTISATSYIWSYIFQDLFVKRTGVDFFENLRAFNKISFNISNDKINNANTIDEVNNITWEFESKNGILIDINEKAKQMLNDPNFDYGSKEIIKKAMDKDGNINLIKKIDI